LGALGAGLTLSGVGAVAGVPLMIAAGLLKLGGSLWGTIRDKTWGKGKAAAKAQKEMDWAGYMAKNYQDPNVKRILKELGAESIATNDEQMGALTIEQRTEVMKKQLMKR
jgi:hypothetical protein